MEKAETYFESWMGPWARANAFRDLDEADVWMTQTVRIAIACTVPLQLSHLAIILVRFPWFARSVAPILLCDLALTLLVLGWTWTRSFHEGWRETVFAWSSALVLSAAMVGMTTHQMTAFFLALVMMLFGTAAFAPWGALWQSSFSLVCLGTAVTAARMAPQAADSFQPYRLLELATAAVISLFLASLTERYRSSVKQRLEGLAQTIDGLRAAEREIAAAREAAEAASRAKSEFLSCMSHEIRTPMNAILGMAEVLGASELNAEQRKYLSIMMNNGGALLDLINAILDLARIESGRLQLEQTGFDLYELTQSVAETLALRAHQKGLELAVEIAPPTPQLLVGDPLRVRQVLVNLLGNAIKFTARGKVALEIRPEDEHGKIRFTIRDSGIGISPERLEQIFTSYAQAESSTARRYGGSGLGLAIVKQLAELMDGRVTVESELNRGSAFHFVAQFGLAAEPAAAPAVALTPGAAPRVEAGPRETAARSSCSPVTSTFGRQLRVLVADDSQDNRLLLEAFLNKTGCRLDQAEDGAVAARKFMENRYDIVLMDIHMPEMDGYTAVSRIRAWEKLQGLARTPIIALTASVLDEAVGRTLAVGCDTHISKPVRRETLIAAIRELVTAAAGATERTIRSDIFAARL
ncbi:MAG: ATP-binding protein [Candidatus Binataceae bacterium]